MESVFGPTVPGQESGTAPSDQQDELSNTVFNGYMDSYEKQIVGLQIGLAGTAIYTLGQIEQLQQSIIELFLDRLQSKEQKQQEQQRQQKERQEHEKLRFMQDYIGLLEKTVQQLQKQIEVTQKPENK